MDEPQIDWTGCAWVERVPGLPVLPVMVGTQVPVDAILWNFKDDRGPGEIAWMFGVDEAHVRGVLLFAGYDPDEEKHRIDWTGCDFVERVRGRMSGVPVLVGTRVTPEAVLANYQDYDVEEVADMFSLNQDHVRGVLRFAGHLRAAA